MPVYNANTFDDMLVSLLKKGSVGVIRTDTLYGLVACADNDIAVERVFTVKGRANYKAPIVLISHTDQLFDKIDDNLKQRLAEFWPGKNSIILPTHTAPGWITRGNATVAYRLPDDPALRALIDKVGPLVAPSANPEGLHPAMTIAEAQEYFGDKVDFYIDSGEVTDDTPSKLLQFGPAGMERLR